MCEILLFLTKLKKILIFSFFLLGGVFIKLFVDTFSVLVRIDGPYPRRSTVVFGRGINHASPYVLLNDLQLVPKDLNISFSKLGEVEPAPYEYNVIIRGSHKDFGGMCAAISSIYANAKNPNHLHFHVFLHPQLIHLFRIAQNEIPNLVNIKRITVRTFDSSQFNQSFDISKLFLLDIFKEIENNFVYIDPDVLVQGDITELWRLRLKDHEVALVPNECHGSQKRGVNLFWRFSSNLNFDNDEVKTRIL
ncbi:hypothetical protein Anas_04684 [Armadillidium nasatum]|uniref:Uncharacterized protein n=1 Tax=Armadillidium nasatum TaxID=96803 RepID=A0A5N5T134_9CRUS|nr:hypothetical protein Anas_04684 [Armadillidium nasatum]